MSNFPVCKALVYCCVPLLACSTLAPEPSNALFKASALSVAVSISLNDVYISCAVDAISSSVVGNPSIPSDNVLMARSESSADTPRLCSTLGNFCNVSKRLTACPTDLRNSLNAAAPTATNPNDLAKSFMLLLDFSPDFSRLSTESLAVSTLFPSTSISILVVPSANHSASLISWIFCKFLMCFLYSFDSPSLGFHDLLSIIFLIDVLSGNLANIL